MDIIIEDQVTSKRKDKGFTLVELLIVIVILGILATVTVFAVRGITDQGQKSACDTDKVTLQTAVETFFAQYPGLNAQIPTLAVPVNSALMWGTGSPAITAVTKPATVTFPVTNSAGATPADTLVNAGLLRAVPANYFVQTDGKLYKRTTACLVGAETLGVLAG